MPITPEEYIDMVKSMTSAQLLEVQRICNSVMTAEDQFALAKLQLVENKLTHEQSYEIAVLWLDRMTGKQHFLIQSKLQDLMTRNEIASEIRAVTFADGSTLTSVTTRRADYTPQEWHLGPPTP